MNGIAVRLLREVRLVPVVLVAAVALFALKALGLILDGGYLFDRPAVSGDDVEITGTAASGSPLGLPVKPAASKQSWAQEMFNFPGGRGGSSGSDAVAPVPRVPGSPRIGPSSNPDVTGAVGEAPAASAEPTAKPANGDASAKKVVPETPPSVTNGRVVPLDSDRPVSAAERAILESLQKRRAELDARAHDLDMRENLLLAAEKRVAGRIEELKELEARIDSEVQHKDEAEAARFKNVVTMYENMKAKDAAKIFDGLDLKVLLDVARAINPRNMSEILAQMTPEVAQRLTAELAVRPDKKDQTSDADLPKIQGRPTPN
jgi:flagellar motility protein MotE (MotC chaperone)